MGLFGKIPNLVANLTPSFSKTKKIPIRSKQASAAAGEINGDREIHRHSGEREPPVSAVGAEASDVVVAAGSGERRPRREQGKEWRFLLSRMAETVGTTSAKSVLEQSVKGRVC